MLQKEVADAVTGGPGDWSQAGIGVQVYAEGRRLFDVLPAAFRPPPKVMSSVIRLDLRAEPLVPAAEREAFFDTVHAGFRSPRKQLRNSLASGLSIVEDDAKALIVGAGLDPSVRPAMLSIGDWLRLTRARKASAPDVGPADGGRRGRKASATDEGA
jgi:16S rRNA (adenine1518-N6/adenine1519-N6)-dimethyltransferase